MLQSFQQKNAETLLTKFDFANFRECLTFFAAPDIGFARLSNLYNEAAAGAVGG